MNDEVRTVILMSWSEADHRMPVSITQTERMCVTEPNQTTETRAELDPNPDTQPLGVCLCV